MGSPDGPAPVVASAAPKPATARVEACGGAGIAWLVVAIFAALVLIVCWADIKAGLVRAWDWIRARFRREPKP